MPERPFDIEELAARVGERFEAGKRFAIVVAAEGAKLALVDQDEVGLGQVAADIEAAGGSAIIIPADVSSDAEARAGVDRVVEKWDRVDVLLTAAASSGPLTRSVRAARTRRERTARSLLRVTSSRIL